MGTSLLGLFENGEHGRGFASRSIVFGVAFFAHGERYNKRAFGLFPIPHLEIAHSGLKHGHGTGTVSYTHLKRLIWVSDSMAFLQS